MKKSDEPYFQGLAEKEVWNLFRAGDIAAFDFVYQQYFDRLYNYGCQFTKDRDLVEDAIQELFIELNRRGRNLSETDKILPYLFSAFRRKIILLRERSSRFKDLDMATSFEVTPGAEEAMIADETQQERLKRLQSGLGQLSEKYREIIFLFYYENLSYEEIREIQEFENVKSVRNLLYKALNSLRGAVELLAFFLWAGGLGEM